MATKRNIGNEIIQSMEDAVKYMRGKKTRAVVHKIEIPDNIDVKSIRKNLNLSRVEFANRYGFSSRTLQHWEQGDRHPQGPAKVLLVLLQRKPKEIEKILRTKKVSKHTNTRATSRANNASKHTIISSRIVSRANANRMIHKKKAR